MEWHFPGQNFTGPGTHIYSNIIQGIEPRNRTDFATMMHDVDYMIATNNKEALISDIQAMKRSDYSLAGTTTKMGLALRSILLPSHFYGGNKELGIALKTHIKRDPRYELLAEKFGLSEELKQW